MTADFRAGDVVVLTTKTLHGSIHNSTSDKMRFSCKFCRSGPVTVCLLLCDESASHLRAIAFGQHSQGRVAQFLQI